jgi:hypothetical protein
MKEKFEFIIRTLSHCVGAIAILLLTFVATQANTITKVNEDAPSLEGRWDIVVMKDGQELPSWLEVQHSGVQTLVGRFVWANGSARPISKVNFKDGKFSFTIPPQWEKETKDLEFEGTLTATGLTGTVIYVDGKKYNWTGVRAPLLKREGEPVYGEPITLFNGVDLKGWHAMGENQWKVENGILTSAKSGSNLVSDMKFTDFKLHIEFRYQKGSNSGVYLRGRYEVQIEDSKGRDPWVGYLGAVYGFLTPSEMVAKEPGEWQSYDITLRGRMVTIIGNNKTIIVNQEIPGITGGAIDSKEGEPGPIMMQGDHGPIEYRNIIITPIK